MRVKIDRFIYRFNLWLSAYIKVVLLAVIALVILWAGVSVYANATAKHNQRPQAIPPLPQVTQAHWVFIVKATGETLLSNEKTDIGPGSYVLHGYYELNSNEWEYHPGNLRLNEKYFGPIKVIKR